MNKFVMMGLAAVTAMTAHVLPASAETLKVALILPGPITDGTFNSAAHQGMEKAKTKYDIRVSVRENTQFAEIEETMLSYARDGFDVVIGHGFQFAEPAMKIHKQFPKTWFIVNTAKVAAAPNLASFDNRWGDAGYVAGAVAAIVSRKGAIGHVGGIPVPVIKEYNEGFARGAKHVRKDIKVLSAYVGSFSDVAKGKEITTSMIESGADVVTSSGNENVLGTIQAAKEAKVMAIGTAFDAHAIAPGTVVTTALINMDRNIDMAIGKVFDKSIEPKNYLLGFNEDGVGLAPFRDFASRISDADQKRIQDLIADIKAGKITDLPAVQ